MSDRSFDITITEEQADLLLKLLWTYEKTCKNNSTNALKAGFGTVTSITKAEEWTRKKEFASELCSKISEGMI